MKTIFSEGELIRNSVVVKLVTTAAGKTYQVDALVAKTIVAKKNYLR